MLVHNFNVFHTLFFYNILVKEKSTLNSTVSEQNNVDERRLRDEEVARKRELENKRRDQAKV